MANSPDTSSSGETTMSANMQQRLDDSWAALQEARRSLAEVMSDDELRELGFNLEELDRRP